MKETVLIVTGLLVAAVIYAMEENIHLHLEGHTGTPVTFTPPKSKPSLQDEARPVETSVTMDVVRDLTDYSKIDWEDRGFVGPRNR